MKDSYITAEKNLLKKIHLTAAIKQLTIKNLTINYIVAGSGHPIILIHGANIGWGQWYTNLTILSTQYKVYALDLPGSGGSTKIDYASYPMATESVVIVDNFVRAMKLKKVHIIGHSFGGFIALKLALLHKSYLDKIVVINPMGFTDTIPFTQKIIALYPLVRLLKKTVMRPTKKNMKNFLMTVLKKKEHVHDAFVDYYYASVLYTTISHPFDFMHSLTENLRIKKEIVLTDDIKSLKNPILLIVGDKDPLTPIKNILKYASSHLITLKILPGIGHVPSIEDPKTVNTLILNFLS